MVTQVSKHTTFGLIEDATGWEPLTSADQQHLKIYGLLVERHKECFEEYRKLYVSLQDHTKKLKETNKQDFSLLKEKREEHLRIQETFARIVQGLKNFCNELVGRRDSLVATGADWAEKNRTGQFSQLHRLKLITYNAAANTVASLGDLRSDMERDLEFFTEQSDRLYEVCTSDPTNVPHRLDPMSGWWVPVAKHNELYGK